MKKVIAQEVSIMLRYTQYMGNEYRLVKYKEYILSTINAEKADDSFLSDDNPKCFYKPISIDDLSDIYDYKLYADCYSGVPGVSCEWDLCSGYCSVKEDGVNLTLHKEGDFEDAGWKKLDRDTHEKWVDNSKLMNARIQLIYYKKNGKEYDPPFIEQIPLKTSGLYKCDQHYRNM